MAAKKDRLNTETFIQKHFAQPEQQAQQPEAKPEPPQPEAAPAVPEAPKKKAKKDEKITVTLRISAKLDEALSANTGRGKREKDRSALVSKALDIVLGMSDKSYEKLKAAAQERGCTEAKIISDYVNTL